MPKKHSLFALGNPLLDISVTVDVSYLNKYGLKENDAILAEEKHMQIYEDIKGMNPNYLPGGATQNAVNVAQWMLLPEKDVMVFTGCIKDDENGKILDESCKKNGVLTAYQYHQGKEPTGICACLINGHKRSLVTNLAAANCFQEAHLDEPTVKQLMEEAQFYYISSFVLTSGVSSMLRIARHAAEHGKTFMINLSAPFLCQFFMEPMLSLIPYVGVLFGNETEATHFAETNKWEEKDPKDIALRISKMPLDEALVKAGKKRLVVITQGADPTITAIDGQLETWPVPAVNGDKIVDTNGAGDAFVGGFLTRYIEDQPLKECIRAATWAGQLIIQQMGCSLPAVCNFTK